jgi:hypothetical protein
MAMTQVRQEISSAKKGGECALCRSAKISWAM